MLEDLRKLRDMLDGFIEKYAEEIKELSKQAETMDDTQYDLPFKHNPNHVVTDLTEKNGKEILTDGMEGSTVGNDYY